MHILGASIHLFGKHTVSFVIHDWADKTSTCLVGNCDKVIPFNVVINFVCFMPQNVVDYRHITYMLNHFVYSHSILHTEKKNHFVHNKFPVYTWGLIA